MFCGLALVRTLLFALSARIRDKRAKRAHRLLIGRHSARFGKVTQTEVRGVEDAGMNMRAQLTLRNATDFRI
jgi:hypothetical protein